MDARIICKSKHIPGGSVLSSIASRHVAILCMRTRKVSSRYGSVAAASAASGATSSEEQKEEQASSSSSEASSDEETEEMDDA